LSPHGLSVLPELRDRVWVVLEKVDAGAGGSGQESGKSRREGVGRSRNPLVVNNLLGTSTEASTCHERTSQRPDDHVDFGRINVLVLGDTTASAAQNTERPSLVQDETELILESQLDLQHLISA
jgi:hypothetical protein